MRPVSVQAALEEFVRAASGPDQVERFVDALDRAIVTRTPEFLGDPPLIADLHNSTRAQWRTFLPLLLEPDHHIAVPDYALALPRSIARRGLELRTVLKIYRVAHQALLDYVHNATAELADGTPFQHEVFLEIYNRLDLWLDEMTEHVIATFQAERQRLFSGASARRIETVDAILSGRITSQAEAGRLLGYPLHAWHTAVIVWSETTPIDTVNAQTLISGVSGQIDDPLSTAIGSRELRAWIPSDRPIEAATLSTCADGLAAAQVRLAAGTSAQGISGFRTSLEEAVAVRDLVTSTGSMPTVNLYRELEPLCLMAGRPDLTARMIERELGALNGPGAAMRDLRETLLSYLENGRHVEETARKLFVHKNTVRNRLARIEELRGPLAPSAPLLEVALQHRRYTDARA
ncbi:hypothetical protein FZI85_26025 [Mycobacterium sp. CBMA293]|uniref:PucR family transcriptional regulator n=1 Tax=unclassified Mycolicibacterium TaxID=2636767 RepID=UPI0012DD9E82|nr:MULTISPECIES: helix-turn-helix domain-containing protein [unclassified Mycolicibacterium]MUL47774.1 hypothetical protein [Mycolicibacterium sp. CBMA 360]MUL61708.1 hypothetical protein [Mycolicibacterium sp. CBMA 335]MUL70772.1 hypothetical protein [Mycolicibacterium sp. CBMA 311]MUL97354.1 hypothetical protein [Mycolicibacterium sp. CBMA 230]MUM08557.1 hypothetical protein [Mycolicibacterium sp. CBMA 213]